MEITEDVIKRAMGKRPKFKELCRVTEQALASLEGGEALYGYIFPFSPREDGEKLANRRRQTLNHFDPYPEEITNIYVENIFRSKEDKREVEGVAVLNDYLKNRYYKWLTNEAIYYYLNLPETFLFYERPETPEGVEILSPADSQKLELFIEPSLIFPDSVPYLELDRKDNVELARVVDGKGYMIITKTQIARVDKSGKLRTDLDPEERQYDHEFIDQYGNPAAPLRRHYYRKAYSIGRGVVGRAFFQQIQLKSIAGLQFISMFIEAAYQHLSMKLKMSKQTADATADENGAIGTGNFDIIIEEGGPSSVPTGYIAMPAMELQTMMKLIFEVLPEIMFRLARLRLPGSTTAATGIAKLMEAIPELNAITKAIETVWQFDEDTVKFIAANFKGAQGKKVVVSYPSNHDVRSTTEKMADIATLAETISTGKVPSSPTLVGEIMKRLFRAILPDISKELLDKGEKEIDDFIKNGEPPVEATKALANKVAQGLPDGKPQPIPIKEVDVKVTQNTKTPAETPG
jgi:hypothetical protein